jgi:hypothetical protein
MAMAAPRGPDIQTPHHSASTWRAAGFDLLDDRGWREFVANCFCCGGKGKVQKVLVLLRHIYIFCRPSRVLTGKGSPAGLCSLAMHGTMQAAPG